MTEEAETEVPLTKEKTKRYYESTPARKEAVEKMLAARRRNQELRAKGIDPKTIPKEEKPKEEKPKVVPPSKPELKRQPKEVIQQEEEDSEPEIVIVRKKKPKKKIIIEESSSDDEPIIVKRKKEPKEKEVKAPRGLQVAGVPPPPPKAKEPEKIDYRAMFC